MDISCETLGYEFRCAYDFVHKGHASTYEFRSAFPFIKICTRDTQTQSILLHFILLHTTHPNNFRLIIKINNKKPFCVELIIILHN